MGKYEESIGEPGEEETGKLWNEKHFILTPLSTGECAYQWTLLLVTVIYLTIIIIIAIIPFSLKKIQVI